MFRRARHQQGSLQRVKRKSGETVWVFRWRETQIDGSRKYRKVLVGSVEEFKTESEAQNAVDALRLTINEQTPRQQLKDISFQTLVDHYRQHEMPDIFYKKSQLPEDVAEDENRKAYATQDTYEGYLKKWILPRWRSYRLPDVKPVHVEQWLKSLSLAPGSKAKIRNIMSALYSHAIRWEWATRNPITHVRQSAKRRKIPLILSILQIKAFLSHLKEPCRTAVLLDASSGLRVGELLGLKWGDVDFEPLGSQAEDHPLQDRSLSQADTTRSGVGRSVVELEAPSSLSTIERLDVCQSAQKWQATILAGCAFSRPAQTGSGSRRNPWQCGMAYATTHVRHFDESEWRRHENDSGTLAPFKLQGDGGYLHTSGDTNQTCGADQIGKNDLAHKGCRWGGLRALVSYWTLLNPRPRCQFSVSSLFCWRPRRDLNPCYRRERAMS